jgi:hypothetical protein
MEAILLPKMLQYHTHVVRDFDASNFNKPKKAFCVSQPGFMGQIAMLTEQ